VKVLHVTGVQPTFLQQRANNGLFEITCVLLLEDVVWMSDTTNTN